MPHSRRLATALAIAVTTLAAAAAGPAHADDLPVRWDGSALLAGGLTPDHVPGANDFSCRPQGDTRPVVLVHGLGATAGDNWATMGPLLKNNGFCVFALTYGRQEGFAYVGGLKRMQKSAQELDAFVDRVLDATDAAEVDLVGHSQGTVMPRWWIHFLGGEDEVRRYVQLTPLWDGTNLAGTSDLLAVGSALWPDTEMQVGTLLTTLGCGSCPQFVRGSSYLDAVNAAGPTAPGIEYTGIATKYDELVVPYTSGLLDAPNVKNIVLQDVCPQDYAEHLAVAYDPNVGQMILNALAPERARPVDCARMTPLGAIDQPDVGLDPAPTSTSTASTARIGRVLSPLAVVNRRGRGLVRLVPPRSGALRDVRLRLRRASGSARILAEARTTRLSKARRVAVRLRRDVRLRPGTYRLELVAKDSDGDRVRTERTVRLRARG